MAGFRLAPKAARARRNPWQRRRLAGARNTTPAGTVSDGFTITDGLSFTLSTSRSVSDGFTITDAVVGANPSSGTATGGLIFLFSQGTVGSALTRSVSDGFTITDSVSRVLVPVATNSFSRTCSDGFTLVDAASGSVVAGSATPALIGVDLEFTALLDVELSFVGE